MKSNRCVLKLLCLTVTLIALSISPFAAAKHRAANQKRSVAERRQSPSKNGRDRRRGLQIAVRGGKTSKHARLSDRRRLAAQRRAEAARQAAIARQRALDESMRNRVQALIAKDDTRGEDAEVRRIAINALGDHAGTVVVMDPKTGRVYSIVNQEWGVSEGFKPCSTIKLVTGLAGLNEKVIDPSEVTNVSTSSHMNLTEALAHSNNTYFQQVGGRVGFDKMVSYARLLGLGEKTGINARNETPGQLPIAKSGFAVNHMSSHGDDFKVSALQLATLVSAMANGGKLLSPQITRSPQEDKKFTTLVRREVNIDPQSWRYMVPGMIGAVNYGSGRKAYNAEETVAAKTGTCIEQGTWVGLFASYAPVANPRLAVVVIARGADAHSHFPAVVAGRIYRDLNGRFGTPTDLPVAMTPEASGNNGDANAGLNEEEQDEVEQSDSSGSDTTLKVTSPANVNRTSVATTPDAKPSITKPLASPSVVNSKVKQVLMPIPSRNQAATPAANSPKTSSTPLTKLTQTSVETQQRPRRVMGGQQ